MTTIDDISAARSIVAFMQGILSHMTDTNPSRQMAAKLVELDRLLAA